MSMFVGADVETEEERGRKWKKEEEEKNTYYTKCQLCRSLSIIFQTYKHWHKNFRKRTLIYLHFHFFNTDPLTLEHPLLCLIQGPLGCFTTFLSNFLSAHASGYHVFSDSASCISHWSL